MYRQMKANFHNTQADPPGMTLARLGMNLASAWEDVGVMGFVFHVVKERPPASRSETTVTATEVLMHAAATEVREQNRCAVKDFNRNHTHSCVG